MSEIINNNPFSKIIDVLKSMNPRYRWNAHNGYKHTLRICLPLIAANISVSAMLFTDRLFLSHYSMEAIAASLPSGVMLITVASFFQGLVAYVSVFTAQYTGAGTPRRAAASLWQGIYMAMGAGVLIALTYFLAPTIFTLGGHPENVQELEVIFYRILALGSFLNLTYFAMSSFLAGMGKTRVVMMVNVIGAFLNIPLDYLLIFGLNINGSQIIPELGIRGAGYATVSAWFLTTAIFSIIIFNKKMDKSHGILKSWSLDLELLKRMIKYGSPGGLERFLELAAFTYFTFIIGKLGEVYMAANNIIFSIESLSFFPMIGVGATVSILVGQSIGGKDIKGASEAVLSGIGISSCYLLFITILFLVFPKFLLGLFLADNYDPLIRQQIMDLGVVILRFVVVYTLFDGLYLCCFGALSGAGDVWFPMIAMGLAGIFCLVVPISIMFQTGTANIYALWTVFVLYVLSLTVTGTLRYRSGKWRNMRVIEYPPHP